MVLSLYFFFHQWELFVDARGRRLLPNLVEDMVFFYLLLFSALAVIIFYQCFVGYFRCGYYSYE